MFCNNGPLILASGSPRRQEYLQQMGLEFSVIVAQIVEQCFDKEPPQDFVERMAFSKGKIVSENHPESWVISGDTIVCLGNTILGKPHSSDDAVTLLMQLSGREHFVKSGFSVFHGAKGVSKTSSVTTRVIFNDFTEIMARSYVATGEPMDKAGAYGIQGMGAVLVKSIEGSYSNVVGLPVFEIMEVLQNVGAVELCR